MARVGEQQDQSVGLAVAPLEREPPWPAPARPKDGSRPRPHSGSAAGSPRRSHPTRADRPGSGTAPRSGDEAAGDKRDGIARARLAGRYPEPDRQSGRTERRARARVPRRSEPARRARPGRPRRARCARGALDSSLAADETSSWRKPSAQPGGKDLPDTRRQERSATGSAHVDRPLPGCHARQDVSRRLNPRLTRAALPGRRRSRPARRSATSRCTSRRRGSGRAGRRGASRARGGRPRRRSRTT